MSQFTLKDLSGNARKRGASDRMAAVSAVGEQLDLPYVGRHQVS
jgi:hypothetical protein